MRLLPSLAAGGAKAGKASFETFLADPRCSVEDAPEQKGGGSLTRKAGVKSGSLKPSDCSFVK
jgi:hypothetical protein